MGNKWRYEDVYDDAVELTKNLMGTKPMPKPNDRSTHVCPQDDCPECEDDLSEDIDDIDWSQRGLSGEDDDG